MVIQFHIFIGKTKILHQRNLNRSWVWYKYDFIPHLSHHFNPPKLFPSYEGITSLWNQTFLRQLSLTILDNYLRPSLTIIQGHKKPGNVVLRKAYLWYKINIWICLIHILKDKVISNVFRKYFIFFVGSFPLICS